MRRMIRKVNGVVEPVAFDDIKAGDIFKIFEDDGTPVNVYWQVALTDAVGGLITGEAVQPLSR